MFLVHLFTAACVANRYNSLGGKFSKDPVRYGDILNVGNS